MKITLKKDWIYNIYGQNKYKKGMKLSQSKGCKLLPEGFYIPHFYCYNQGEIIPLEYLKISK